MASLPDYVASAQPVPREKRAAWYQTTAQTYAGIMLWFVFWQTIVNGGGAGNPGGVLAAGLLPAVLGVVIAALICHFLFYLVPGLLGMQTGLPLYVVGTSVYGVRGGLIMPGLTMGLLQFGWLAVNAWAVSELLCKSFGLAITEGGTAVTIPSVPHGVIAAIFAALAAFVGLKGIHYLARVASYLPLIPLVVLVVLFVFTVGGIGNFDSQQLLGTAERAALLRAGNATAAAGASDVGAALEPAPAPAPAAPGAEAPGQPSAAREAGAAAEKPASALPPLTFLGVILLLNTYIVGFFATAGAAGTDIASNNPTPKDVQLGGLSGITLATIFSAVLAILIVAGAYGKNMVDAKHFGVLNPIDLIDDILGGGKKNTIMVLLAISSFPPACFSAFIAANSFRTTLPQINPNVSVAIGTLVAIVLAVTGVVGKVIFVFQVIGASFGPVCGAMAADYLLSGRKWPGPRAGFNPAGWISWVAGFLVGAVEFIAKIPGLEALSGKVPAPPVAAFVVGFVLYLVLAKAGLESQVLQKPHTAEV